MQGLRIYNCVVKSMPKAWQTLEIMSSQAASLEARGAAALDSPWFDGHFPGRPMLPGIAMIAMAFDAARKQEAGAGRRIRLKSVTRVRFKKPVCPDEPFSLLLTREEREGDTAFRFTIQVGEEAGCTGILHTEPLAA